MLRPITHRTKIKTGKIKLREVAQYVRDNVDVLAKGKFTLGGWIDEGKAFLDVSKLFKNKEKALKAGKAFDQISITDLSKIPDDIVNAFLSTGGTGKKQNISDEMIFRILEEIGDS